MMSGLFDPDREVVQLHFGGGTPELPHARRSCARRVDSICATTSASATRADRDISIELDPR